MTDPRYIDPRLNDPALRSDESIGGMWTWIAGLAVLALIAFVIIAGGNSNSNTVSNNTAPVNTLSAPMRNVMPPPSTTGSGSSALRPLAPAPAKNGMQ